MGPVTAVGVWPVRLNGTNSFVQQPTVEQISKVLKEAQQNTGGFLDSSVCAVFSVYEVRPHSSCMRPRDKGECTARGNVGLSVLLDQQKCCVRKHTHQK